MKKSFFAIIIYSLLFVIQGCEDDFQEPVETNVKFKVQNEVVNYNSASLSIKEGKMKMSNLNFSMKKNGEDNNIDINKDLEVDLKDGSISETLNFETPEGKYERVNSELTLNEDNGLHLNMNFNSNAQKKSCSIVFDIDGVELLNSEVLSSSGKREIILTSDKEKKLVFTIKLDELMGSISQSMWENAEMEVDNNGDNIKYINENINSDIYLKLVNNLEAYIEAEFK